MSDPKAEIDTLFQSLERLRIEFDRFFRKERKFPPLQDRNRLEGVLRRMGTRSLGSTGDQFRLANLQGRFQSLSGLWERQLRDLEEGRTPGRPSTGAPAGPGAGPVSDDHLDRAVDGWKTARTECGLPAGDAEAAAFRELLRRKAAEIAGSGGGRVEFSVSVEAGKPKIRAALRKGD